MRRPVLPTGVDAVSTIEEPGERAAGEDIPTRLTRGVVDGFTEASEAFSRELAGTNQFPELMGRSVAGMIRATSRLLDEVATLVRQASDGLTAQSPSGSSGRSGARDEIDYERLATLVAARLSSTEPGPGATDAPARRTSRSPRSAG
jgi:hypothetical protein